MKHLLTALAALAIAAPLAAPLGAFAQTARAMDSDDWVCSHGDRGDGRTMDACRRLRDTSADPGPEPGVPTEEAAMALRAQTGAWRVADGYDEWTSPGYRVWQGDCQGGRGLFLVPAGRGVTVLARGRSDLGC